VKTKKSYFLKFLRGDPFILATTESIISYLIFNNKVPVYSLMTGLVW